LANLVGDRFRSELRLRYLKVVCQHGRAAGKASGTATSVVKNNEVKLAAATGDLSGNLTDSSEKAQLLQQPRCDAAPMLRITTASPDLIPSI
jgi:hypothetical protein